MKIRDFLTLNFGESASRIRDDFGYVGDMHFDKASFVIIDDSRTFVLCGGTALIAFSHGPLIRDSYLVIDDTDGQKWDAKRRWLHERLKTLGKGSLTADDWNFYNGMRPHQQLRLVHSGYSRS